MNDCDLYAGREQTLVKHTILRSYLERFAHIVGYHWDTITYVDCFSGPWNEHAADLHDTSFYIALQQLRSARKHLRDSGRDFALRCFFLEKDPARYRQLERFAGTVSDAEVKTRNAALEDSVDDILAFVHRRQHDAFPFIFIDPTGWTGFAMPTIQPLLQLKPGEILINLMTGHILRFIEHSDPTLQRGFDALFGSSEYRAEIAGLAGLDREDTIVRCYCDAVKASGRYEHVCPAIVLQPETNRTHFHLLYATRHIRGMEVFKESEKQAMQVMEQSRAEAQQRSRVELSGQGELFPAQELRDARHYDRLRDRYLTAAETAVKRLLQAKVPASYDQAWITALSHSLVWQSDLNAWISKWVNQGRLQVTGRKPRQRVLKPGAGHQLIWIP